jgi:hypothetical protein
MKAPALSFLLGPVMAKTAYSIGEIAWFVRESCLFMDVSQLHAAWLGLSPRVGE